MASTIKVDKIEGSTGSTITVPTGQTLTVTDGIPVASGGTGLASFTQGDILYATGATTLAKLAKGTAAQVLAINSGATAPEWVAASGGKTVKRHYFEYSTRTAGTGSAGVQFNFTSAFIPTDPTAGNNDLRITSVTPMKSSSGDWGWFGLRFAKSGGSNYDYVGKGLWYVDPNGYQSMVGFDFTIAAGSIPAGTYTVGLYAGDTTAANTSSYFCCNTSDHAQVGVQTVATLMITEYKN